MRQEPVSGGCSGEGAAARGALHRPRPGCGVCTELSEGTTSITSTGRNEKRVSNCRSCPGNLPSTAFPRNIETQRGLCAAGGRLRAGGGKCFVLV